MGLLTYLQNDIVDRVLFDRRLRIAVTGLSRSGKTAFITSLINILENINNTSNPNLKLLQSKIQSVEVISKGFAKVFPYDENLRKLQQDPPQWPQATDDFSEIRLRIQLFDQANLLEKSLSSSKSSKRSIDLDLIDYPGEWLLDLQLLDLTFKQWSKEVAVTNKLHQELGKEFRELLEHLDLQAVVDKSELQKLTASYIDYLKKCKQAGLNFLQPGHFLHGQNLHLNDEFCFFPLIHLTDSEFDQLDELTKKNPHSVFQQLRKTYELYKKNYVESFYEEHFRHFDRQIVLVDCLTPFNYNQEAFKDTQKALNFIFGHFNYGKRSWYNRLFKSRIDKVIFVATKIDYIPPAQIPALEQLFNDLLSGVPSELLNNEQTNHKMVLASIRSLVTMKENDVVYLSGNLSKPPYYRVSFYPSELPTKIPDDSYWENLKPSKLVIHNANQDIIEFNQTYQTFLPLALKNGLVNQINMEQVIYHIIGDKLFA